MPVLLLRFLPHLLIAVAAFYAGLEWESRNTLQAKAAAIQAERDRAALDLQRERDRAAADLAALATTIEQQKRATEAAARIATSASREALTAREIVEEKDHELQRFRDELALARSEKVGCDCRITPDDWTRLRKRFPIGTPRASGGVGAAVGQRSADDMPRPGR